MKIKTGGNKMKGKQESRIVTSQIEKEKERERERKQSTEAPGGGLRFFCYFVSRCAYLGARPAQSS